MRATKALRTHTGREPERRPDPKDAAARKLWGLLDGHASLHFRQRELVGPYLVDFLCPAARLVIRLTGGEDNDPDQTAWLLSHGYRVLSFDAAAVTHNPAAVLDAVADVFTLRVVPGKS